MEERQKLNFQEKSPKKIKREVSFGLSNQNSNQGGQEIFPGFDQRNSTQYDNSQYSISNHKIEKSTFPPRSSSPGYFSYQSAENLKQSPESNFNPNAINSSYQVKTKNYLNNIINNDKNAHAIEANRSQVSLNLKNPEIHQIHYQDNEIESRNVNEVKTNDYIPMSQIERTRIMESVNQEINVSNFILANGAIYNGKIYKDK